MGRSGSVVAVTALLALAVCGCTSTQHEAQRERLESARQRAELEPTRVTTQSRVVVVRSVSTVHAGRRTAFVVTVRNRGHRAVADLPILIGYSLAGGTHVYLNTAAGLPYFEAHLPAVRAGRELTWVFSGMAGTQPVGARPVALVGLRPSPPALLTEMNVRIDASYRTGPDHRTVSVTLSNPTSVPQYQLQVYAYAVRGGRFVAAGSATVADLGGGAKMHVRLRLVGSPSGRLHVEAPPTVLQ